MEKKQKAVQWLKDKITFVSEEGEVLPKYMTHIDLKEYFEQAEQMFEEQIKEAVKFGYIKDVEDVDSEFIEQGTNESEKYFEQTFKNRL
jgi:hypothetical protein